LRLKLRPVLRSDHHPRQTSRRKLMGERLAFVNLDPADHRADLGVLEPIVEDFLGAEPAAHEERGDRKTKRVSRFLGRPRDAAAEPSCGRESLDAHGSDALWCNPMRGDQLSGSGDRGLCPPAYRIRLEVEL